METLQREMTKMQEHNHILSSKLDDTQKQLHEQQSRSAQLQDGLEQTTQLRQERPLKSISKPNDQRAEKQPAQDGPSASRRLFIPTSAECHEEYQVYSDCRFPSKLNPTIGIWTYSDQNLPFDEGTT
ncbi:unnamed protein product [Prunus brigantina]